MTIEVKVGQIYKVCGMVARPTIGIVRTVTKTNASLEIIIGDKNWAHDNDGWVPFPLGCYKEMVLLPTISELCKLLYL